MIKQKNRQENRTKPKKQTSPNRWQCLAPDFDERNKSAQDAAITHPALRIVPEPHRPNRCKHGLAPETCSLCQGLPRWYDLYGYIWVHYDRPIHLPGIPVKDSTPNPPLKHKLDLDIARPNFPKGYSHWSRHKTKKKKKPEIAFPGFCIDCIFKENGNCPIEGLKVEEEQLDLDFQKTRTLACEAAEQYASQDRKSYKEFIVSPIGQKDDQPGDENLDDLDPRDYIHFHSNQKFGLNNYALSANDVLNDMQPTNVVLVMRWFYKEHMAVQTISEHLGVSKQYVSKVLRSNYLPWMTKLLKNIKLSKKQRHIAEMCFLEVKRQKEIAETLKVSEPYISKVIRGIRVKMVKNLKLVNQN